MDSVNLTFSELSLLQSTSMSDQEEAQPAQASLVEISETGDVFLIVGPEQVKLRVQSLILKATSKPFAAMLGPNWMKGREQPSPEKPIKILLPEDNAVSLKYICAVTHSRIKMIPEALSAQDLFDIVITADKYDFLDALTLVSRLWLNVSGKDAAESMLLLAVAYLFRNAQAFKQHSRAFIMDYTGSYLDLYTEQIEMLMDWRVVYWLEERRNFTRLKLGETFLEGAKNSTCEPRCYWTSYTLDWFSLRALHSEFKHLANNQHAIRTSINELTKTFNTEGRNWSCPCRRDMNAHNLPGFGLPRERLRRLEEGIGLCLDCILLNRPNPGDCHAAH